LREWFCSECVLPRSGGGWYKAPERLAPDPPPTGFSHPKCYLRESRDCSQTLSDEHYFSANALKTVAPMLQISGVPWVKGGISNPIPVERFTSRVRCKRYNEAFSPIDAQGGRFVRWVRDFCNLSASPRLARVLFNGHDIERWCLKTFLGLLAAGILQIAPNQVIRQVYFPPQVVDLLFGRVADEWGRGLWIRTDPQRLVSTDLALSVSVVSRPGTIRLTGLTFNLFGFDFAYLTTLIPVEDSVFRPSHFRFHRPDGVYTIEFLWAPGVPHSGPVECHSSGRATPELPSSGV
jgi:hypothetical protein